MLEKMNLELIREIDITDTKKVIILVSSFDKIYQLIFNNIVNFSYSIDFDKEINTSELDIIDIQYQYDYPTNETLRTYSYRANKELSTHKLHYLFIYGDIELTILSKALSVNEIGKV